MIAIVHPLPDLVCVQTAEGQQVFSPVVLDGPRPVSKNCMYRLDSQILLWEVLQNL